MCGIVGAYGWADDAMINSMLESIAHRGPDERGQHVESDLMMGSCRLSIVDLASGSQPMYNEDGDVSVVFNGEIYNHESLREDLEAAGHRLETQCDTEVLVHLWEEYGKDMPKYLDGMFAFAIRDESRDVIFLARDRLGIKPLYYAETDRGLLWASEIQALLCAGVERTIDSRAVSEYFTFKYTPWPRTPLQSVKKLPPGGRMLVSNDGVTRDRYWTLTPTTVEGDIDHVAREIRSQLERSVRQRLMADVPVGAFLSGGLDSSAIVGIMSQYTDDINTYSAAFEYAEYDEQAEAKRVADHFGTDHHVVDIDSSSMDVFGDIIEHHGEPLADAAAVPTILLSKRARKDVKVVLSGAGADELFIGYRHYGMLNRHRQRYGSLPEPMYSLADWTADRVPPLRKYCRHLGSLRSDERAYLRFWTMSDVPAERYMSESTSEADVAETVASSFPDAAGIDTAQRIAAYDLERYVSDDLLQMFDRTTMAESIEGRVPFLDHRFVEYVYSVPSQYKLDGDYKPLLRRAVSDILPKETLQRSKQQFAVPVTEWFREDHETIARWLTEERIDATPLIDPAPVFELWRAHRNGTNNTSSLWRILNYVAWYHRVVRGVE